MTTQAITVPFGEPNLAVRTRYRMLLNEIAYYEKKMNNCSFPIRQVCLKTLAVLNERKSEILFEYGEAVHPIPRLYEYEDDDDGMCLDPPRIIYLPPPRNCATHGSLHPRLF